MTKPIDPRSIPQTPTERAAWVVMQLKIRGKSFASIAREHGWSKGVVGMAMRAPSYPQERAIAEALGLRVRELFPDRYDGAGNRLHAIRSKAEGDPESNVQGRAAA